MGGGGAPLGCGGSPPSWLSGLCTARSQSSRQPSGRTVRQGLQRGRLVGVELQGDCWEEVRRGQRLGEPLGGSEPGALGMDSLQDAVASLRRGPAALLLRGEDPGGSQARCGGGGRSHTGETGAGTDI